MATSANVVECPNCGKKNRVPAAASGAPRCARCHEPLPWVAEADDATFSEVVEASALPVLVDLWAPWCGPCRVVSPALEQVARHLAGRLKLVKVDVDRSQQVAARFAVQGIPTLLMMQGDRVVARQTGAAPEATLRAWAEEALATVGQPRTS